MNSILEEISRTLQAGRMKEVIRLVEEALDQKIEAGIILNDALLQGMSVIGEKFKNNEIYVPEVLIAARAMNKGLEILHPHLARSGVQSVGKAVLGTVKGDKHDIGKNLVGMMFVGAGLEVIDLGVDVSPERFVDAVREHHPDIVALSALLTTTMVNQKAVIDALVSEGLRDEVKVMIGGAPVTQSFADQIGADAYTPDAASAAEVAKAFVLSRQ